MLAVFLHDLVGPGQQDGGAEKRHVDKDLPLDVFSVFVLDIDERFEKMNAGDADQRGCEFNFDGAGIDVCQSFGSIGMPLYIQFVHEGGIAADVTSNVNRPQDA